MSNAYIIFERMEVQDANCIAGVTYGFPSVTHFLGFSHALSRKVLQSHNLLLQGCAVICHQHQIHAYQPNGFGDYVFAQSKNPPVFKKNADGGSPIIEEGKMNMSVSLIMECPDFKISRQTEINSLRSNLMGLAYQHHLAGGSIQHIESIQIFTKADDNSNFKLMQKIKRILLPGFVLMDRSDLLDIHYKELKKLNPNVELIDAWLDFSSIKYKAEPKLREDELEVTAQTKAEWILIDKPLRGWIVPITNGYKAISPLYSAGEVLNARDSSYPFCFVEASHAIGEWRSLHRIQNVAEMLWHYHHEDDWYLCTQQEVAKDQISSVEIENTDYDFEDNFLNSL